MHFVDSEDSGRIESRHGGPVGNRQLVDNFERIRNELLSADIVVVSGDTTDSGTHDQWDAFLRTVNRIPGLARKILLVPGNHDLNYVASGADLLRTDTANFDGRSLRTAHFEGAARKLASASLSDAPESHSKLDVDNLFPSIRLEKSANGTTVAFVAINTVAPSITFMGNAIGRFLPGQIPAMVKRLQEQKYAVVIVGHHHPLPFFDSEKPARTFLGRISSVFIGAAMESIDGFRFLENLQSTIIHPVLYLHGHKHIFRSHVGHITGIRVCGAPSLLFGDESTGDINCIAVRHDVTIENDRLVFESSVIRTADRVPS